MPSGQYLWQWPVLPTPASPTTVELSSRFARIWRTAQLSARVRPGVDYGQTGLFVQNAGIGSGIGYLTAFALYHPHLSGQVHLLAVSPRDLGHIPSGIEFDNTYGRSVLLEEEKPPGLLLG